MRLWILRSAIRAAIHKIRFPCVRIKSSSWTNEDHSHFCYALRILETGDSLSVCPKAKCNFDVEHEDVCDKCRYFGGVDFLEEDDVKKVRFW